MKAAAHYSNLSVGNVINEPVLGRDTARPSSRKAAMQRFRLTKAAEGIALYVANETSDPDCDAPIVLNPPQKVVEAVLVKDQASQELPLPVYRRFAASPLRDAPSWFGC
jgi:hypothetical protein